MSYLIQIFVLWLLFIPLQSTSSGKAGKNPTLSVRAFQEQTPVLAGKSNNPVLRIDLLSSGSSAITIREVSISLKGTTGIRDIKVVRLFSTGKRKDFSPQRQFGSDEKPSENIRFKGSESLTDTLTFWVSVEWKDKPGLLNKIVVAPDLVITDRGRVHPDRSFRPKSLRAGIALRQHYDDKVHTFRIPGLATTNDGTLLAVYDVRRESSRDLQGDIDIGLSRSIDGGASWEPMRIILDRKNWGGLPEKFNGVSDANILVDKTTGAIYVAGLWMHGVLDKNGKWIEGLTPSSVDWEHQWRNKGSQPGFSEKESAQFLVTRSTDDGISWSVPENVTRMGKNADWWLWAPAPGQGITLDDGTLVMPTQGRDATGQPFSNITWSKDHGISWHSSLPAYGNTTECQAVQLSDGSVMLNMRHNGNRNNLTENNGRAVSITRDLGETWSEHPSSRRALIEPTCMGSLHKHLYTEDGRKKSILLFSNPNSPTTRHHMTIKVSFDDGITWPEEYWLLLDEGKGNGYSCLTSIDESTIGILYEGSQAMLTFEKIPLEEILRKR